MHVPSDFLYQNTEKFVTLSKSGFFDDCARLFKELTILTNACSCVVARYKKLK